MKTVKRKITIQKTANKFSFENGGYELTKDKNISNIISKPILKNYICLKLIKMSLKAVLFDMDGVIVDTEPLHRKAYYKMFEEFGLDVPPELYASFAGATTRRVCRTLIENFKLEVTMEEMFKSKRKHFKEFFYSDPDFGLLDGVEDLIKHYYENDVKLVLASSASHTTINMVFDKFKLDKYFIDKISGEDLEASKPHPEIFIKAAEMANEDRENCMVIEDSTNGIIAAHRAEIFCAGYKGGNTHQQDFTLADIVIKDYKDLEVDRVNKHFK